MRKYFLCLMLFVFSGCQSTGGTATPEPTVTPPATYQVTFKVSGKKNNYQFRAYAETKPLMEWEPANGTFSKKFDVDSNTSVSLAVNKNQVDKSGKVTCTIEINGKEAKRITSESEINIHLSLRTLDPAKFPE